MNVLIALTMRVTDALDYSEARDALAQGWSRFMLAALPEAGWVPLPNSQNQAVRMAQQLGVNGLVLTGGDSWGVYPERDATEESLFRWAMANHYPVVGICRGAQVINRLLGGSIQLAADAAHVATRHPLRSTVSWVPDECNSFHRMVLTDETLASGLECVAHAPDGTVEAFHLPGQRVAGIGWHPERETPFRPCDITFMRRFFLAEDI